MVFGSTCGRVPGRFNNFDVLLEGVGLTLQLSAITMVLGLALGIVMALLKTWGCGLGAGWLRPTSR